jgi:hypothetical protein
MKTNIPLVTKLRLVTSPISFSSASFSGVMSRTLTTAAAAVSRNG